MKKWLSKKYAARPGAFLLVAAYGLAIALFLLAHFGLFAANRVLYATGALSREALSANDFEWFGLEPVDGANTQFVTTDADPRLELKDKSRRVETVAISFTYARRPRSRTVFWAKPGQDYSVWNMAYSVGGEGRLFCLPVTGGQSLRIDPETVPGNLITVEGIEINVPRPFWAFFTPSALELMVLCVAPGLAAACVSIARQFFGREKAMTAPAGKAGDGA